MLVTGMRVTGDWISSEPLQRLLRCLTAGGHVALLVGGCVRNDLLGQPVADIDIATDALPLRVVELASGAGFRTVPTGIDHGTVTVIADGEPHEVTTFRRDVETDGRRAVVAFTEEVTEDAARRDFTMNALYADAEGNILDPIGGVADLRARRVRFVGEPEARIREDYLRILRFFRFHAWYGDPAEGPDPDALAACAALSAGLEPLSKERIGHEMRRLLAAPDPTPALAAMQASGVLARVLPGADTRMIGPLVHVEDGLPPVWLRRLAALGGTSPDAALRLSRDEARRLAQLTEFTGSDDGPEVLGYRIGADAGRDVLLLRAAMSGQAMPEAWQHGLARGATARFPVTSADLRPAFSGPALGQRLHALEERWIASGFRLSREQLLA